MALTQASTVASASASKLGIDCHKAKSEVEREICRNPEFLALDRNIATTYAKVLKAVPASDVSAL
ncbi:MAG: hypothetical protein E7774_00425 [Bradyrhizobium sp.]|nr:MAG: hypothetical protein E7774_00425 [Bradyrhizobium sp.]